jgi:hypothetical protein
MTLAELAIAAGTTPKWILNAGATVALPRTYSIALARRLAVVRAIQAGTGTPTPRAYTMAGEALERYSADTGLGRMGVAVTLRGGDAESVAVTVDVHRILSEVNTRESFLRTMYAPKRRGPRLRRPGGHRAAIRAATDWGWDVTLFESTLARSVTERIRQMDSIVQFGRQARASLSRQR